MIGDASWIFPIFCGWALITGVTFLSLFGIVAPTDVIQEGWGPEIPARLGWVSWSPITPDHLVLFLASGREDLLANLVVSLWVFHYTYRSFLYPFWAKMGARRCPCQWPSWRLSSMS